jgi:hypothetical protein
MRRSAIIRLVFIPLGAACASACAPDGAGVPVAERTDSAGVQVVMNRGPDRPLLLEFTPRLTLGGKDSGPEAFFRVTRGTVDVDGSGRVYVLDFEANTIAVFDSTGQFVRTLGGTGGGPGELQFPNGIRAKDDGTVAVYDFAKDGLIRWGPDGSVLPTLRVKATSPLREVAFTGDGLAYSWTSYAREDTVERSMLQVERGDSVTSLATIERPRPELLEFRGCGIRMALPPLFSPDIVWTTNGRRIAWASGTQYEVAVLDSGGRRMLVRRDLPPRDATPELAQREVGDSLRVRGGTLRCAIAPDAVVEARGFAPVIPSIRSVSIARDGSLWVQRTTPRNDPPLIDVFSADGEYRGTLPAGSPVPLAFFPNGDIGAAKKSADDDVERLVVYRVTPVPGAPD